MKLTEEDLYNAIMPKVEERGIIEGDKSNWSVGCVRCDLILKVTTPNPKYQKEPDLELRGWQMIDGKWACEKCV